MKHLNAFTENGKWGYKIEETNEILVPPLYDEIISTIGSYLVRIDNKYGVLNEEADTIVPIIYDKIEVISNDFKVCLKNKWGFIMSHGEKILPAVFDEILDVGAFQLKVTFQGKKGIVTKEGNILIPIDYEDVCVFGGDNTFGVKKNGKWQLLDRKNKAKTPQLYDTIKKLSGTDMIAVLQDKKWSFIYTNGQEASSLRVDNFFWSHLFLQIKINKKWGVLNWKLEEVLPVEYDKIKIENLGLHKRGTDSEIGVVDQTLKWIIPPIYDYVNCRSDLIKIIGKKEREKDYVYIPPQYITVKKEYYYGLFDVFGKKQVPVIYDYIQYDAYEDLFPICLDGKWGYMNTDNEVIVDFIYDGAEKFSHRDYATVSINGKFGIIDRKGKRVCPIQYEFIFRLEKDLIKVIWLERDGMFYIDPSTGEVVERHDKRKLVNISTVLNNDEYNKQDVELLIAYTENGKWGYRDKETNEILIPAIYDEIDPSAEKLEKEHTSVFQGKIYYMAHDEVCVKLNGKWGIRSRTNKEILPVLYDEIGIYYSCYKVSKNKKYGILNKNKEIIISMMYDEIRILTDDFIVKNNDKYGIINKDGEIIVPIIYDEIDTGSDVILVCREGKWGAYNGDGLKTLPIVFDKILRYMSSFLGLTFRGKAGAITPKGNIIIPFDYDDVYLFNKHNIFGVKKNGKWQLTDRKNRLKNPQFYDAVKEILCSNVIGVMQDGKWEFVYENGQEASPLHVDDFIGANRFLLIKNEDKWGVMDSNMEIIVPVEYDKIEIENLELQEYPMNGKLGVVNKEDDIILPPIYDYVDWYDKIKIICTKRNRVDFIYIPQQYIKVREDDKWGIFDIDGNEKVPVMYDEFKITSYDLFPARLNDKWGYINVNNDVIVPFIYDEVGQFWKYPITEVAIDKKYGLIDRKGNVVYPIVCDWVCILENNLARIEQNGELFHIDQTGKIIERYDRNSLVHITTFLKEMGVDCD